MTALSWRVHAPHGTAWLTVRPFLTGRDYHALHHENPAFQFTPAEDHARLTWSPYPGVPGVVSLSNGVYRHHPEWYRNVLYTEERVRGLDDTEDVASPGELKWDVTDQKAVWILASKKTELPPISQPQEIEQLFNTLRASELRRRKFVTPLIRSADAYIVRRQHRVASAEGQTNTERGTTIIAGYPWFTDWGRDTFIALRGLCIATGRLDVACRILREWAGADFPEAWSRTDSPTEGTSRNIIRSMPRFGTSLPCTTICARRSGTTRRRPHAIERCSTSPLKRYFPDSRHTIRHSS